MTELTFEDGIVRLGDQDAPGILKALSVRGQIKYDETKLDARNGRAKIPAGWDDADITVTVDLLTDDEGTCYKKLRVLTGIFRAADSSRETTHGQTVTRPPKVYTVVNQHINARGIRTVLFSGLASSETDDDDTIQAIMTFTESGNPAAGAEMQAQGTDRAPAVASADPAIAQDDEVIEGTI